MGVVNFFCDIICYPCGVTWNGLCRRHDDFLMWHLWGWNWDLDWLHLYLSSWWLHEGDLVWWLLWHFGLWCCASVPKGGILCGQSITMWLYSSHSKHQTLGQWCAIWPDSWHWKQQSSSLDIMFTVEDGTNVVASCCVAWSFSTSYIASVSICGPFS